MKYKEIKEISRYRDADVCVNGEGPIDKEYYKGKSDNLPVVGIGNNGKTLLIDLVCSNWEKRSEPNWVAKI